MDDSDDETEVGTCWLESEHTIITTKEALRAFKILTWYYDAHGSDKKLDVNMFSVKKDLKRQLSSSTKQINIIDF